MMIELRFTITDGRQLQHEFEDDVDLIVLDAEFYRIVSINLSPLSSCTSLQKLVLVEHQLQSIDLSPLSSCTSLKELSLWENQLQSIDLAPLSSCTSLKKLSLWENQLQSIDFTPLSSCTNLQELVLNRNQLQFINLSPLSSCTRLSGLHLCENQLQSIDLAPLSSCSNLQTLSLCGNQFETINLTPLSSCTNLQKLVLRDTQLRSIDLSPLSSCSSLEELYLQENQLQSIDLSLLSTCTSLKQLLLSENQLETIDLSPLSSCANLQTLDLNSNQLQSIDLSPLFSCTRLSGLRLAVNQLQSIDLTPFFSNPRISCLGKYAFHSWLKCENISTKYERPTIVCSWPFLHRVAEQHGTDRRVQQDILYAMGLGDYGFIDCDLRDLFLSIPADTPIEKVRENLTVTLVNEIAAAVDSNRAITGLKLKELLNQHSELAKRAPRIIELRNSDIQQVHIGERDDEVDLRELWVTAYGYDVLSALDMRLTTNHEGFEGVKRAFTDLGFELKTNTTKSSPGVKMSDELKEVILWIVENRSKSWETSEGESKRTDSLYDLFSH